MLRSTIVLLILLGTGGQVTGVWACGGNPGQQNLAISTLPPGITVQPVPLADTPVALLLPSQSSSLVLRFAQEGYPPVLVMINRRGKGWSAGYVPLGMGTLWVGGIWLGIDFRDGMAFELDPSEVKRVQAMLKRQSLDLSSLPRDRLLVAIDIHTIRE